MSKPRRKNYFVTFSGDSLPTQVRAYDETAARILAERHRRGRTITWHGTEHPQKAALKASGGFRVDRSALAAATREMGLQRPVRLRYSSKVGSTRGNYSLKPTYHDIMVKSYLTPEQASETLWHELTHARQAEEVGGTLTAWANHPGRVKGKYRQEPIEIEARKVAREKIAAGKLLAS